MGSIIRIWTWTSWRVYKVCLQLWPVVGGLFWRMEVWMGLKVQDPSSPGKPSLTWSTRGLEPAARSPPWSADYWKSTELRNSARTILTVGSRSRLLVPDPTCCCFILLIPFLLSCCWRDAETCWLLNHSISYLRRPHLFSEVFLMEATEVCSMMSPVLVLTVPTTRGRPGQKHRPLPGILTLTLTLSGFTLAGRTQTHRPFPEGLPLQRCSWGAEEPGTAPPSVRTDEASWTRTKRLHGPPTVQLLWINSQNLLKTLTDLNLALKWLNPVFHHH